MQITYPPFALISFKYAPVRQENSHDLFAHGTTFVSILLGPDWSWERETAICCSDDPGVGIESQHRYRSRCED